MTQLPVPVAEQAVAVLAAAPVTDPAARQRIEQLKASLDPASSTSVLEFGVDVEQSMARFADTVLEQVMAKDSGPMHEKLTEIRLIAENLSIDKIAEKKGLIDRLFSSVKREIAKLSDRFKTARAQIDTIAMQLEDQAQEIGYGLAVLDRLFEQNLTRFKDLSLHVVAGQEAIEHWRTALLPAARAATESGGEADRMLAGQSFRDLQAGIDRLDRKVLNLEKSRMIALAMLPTIRQVQQTGITLVEELRMAIAHAIPAWKAAMLVHIEQLRQKHGLETLAATRDFTNRQLEEMARQLDANVEATYRQTEQGIADTDAIVRTMNSLIGTIDKVERLEKEAAAARAKSREALRKAETEFRAKLTDERLPARA